MYFDVDGDGGLEIVARIRCRSAEAMLLAAAEPGPAPTLLGIVLATGPVVSTEPTEGSAVAAIGDYRGRADGTIEVDVTDRWECCGVFSLLAVVQQRSYRWSGSSSRR
jgi:hypothetical protein